MRKLIIVLAIGLLWSGNVFAEKNTEKLLENCATVNYLKEGYYYYFQNYWVISEDQEYIKETKKLVDLLPDNIPGNIYYTKKDNLLSLTYDEKVKFIHRNWTQVKKHYESGYSTTDMSAYINRMAELLKEAILKLSLKDKSKLMKFIDFYETCEYNSIKLPKTFELKYGS